MITVIKIVIRKAFSICMLLPLLAYGDGESKKSPSHLQSILKHYFSITVPSHVLNKKSLSDLENFLEKNEVRLYTNQEQREASSFYTWMSEFKLQNNGEWFLWIYRNISVHNGVMLLLNNKLEAVYVDQNVGCLYGMEVRKLPITNQGMLMVTHGSGGTGTYTQVTDLITFKEGVFELAGSVLKEKHDCNILKFDADSSPCIKCLGNLKFGEKEIAVDLIAEVELDKKNADREKLKVFKKNLTEDFGLTINIPKTFSKAVTIRDINAPIITFAPDIICEVYLSPGRHEPAIRALQK